MHYNPRMETQLPFTIRPATPDDYETVCGLYRELDELHVGLLPDRFQRFDGPVRPREHYLEKVGSPERVLFLAESEGQPAGFIDAQSLSNPPFPLFCTHRYALIDNLYVRERFRGSGLAQSLFESVREWAKERGHQSLELKVYSKNRGAVRFYEKIGMQVQSLTFAMEL